MSEASYKMYTLKDAALPPNNCSGVALPPNNCSGVCHAHHILTAGLQECLVYSQRLYYIIRILGTCDTSLLCVARQNFLMGAVEKCTEPYTKRR